MDPSQSHKAFSVTDYLHQSLEIFVHMIDNSNINLTVIVNMVQFLFTVTNGIISILEINQFVKPMLHATIILCVVKITIPHCDDVVISNRIMPNFS